MTTTIMIMIMIIVMTTTMTMMMTTTCVCSWIEEPAKRADSISQDHSHRNAGENFNYLHKQYFDHTGTAIFGIMFLKVMWMLVDYKKRYQTVYNLAHAYRKDCFFLNLKLSTSRKSTKINVKIFHFNVAKTSGGKKTPLFDELRINPTVAHCLSPLSKQWQLDQQWS